MTNCIFDTLNSLNQAAPLNTLREIVESADVTLEDVRAHVFYDNEHYTRNRVLITPHVEARVLCWLPGQSSPIHDHSGSACIIKVLNGELTECTYELNHDTPIAIAANKFSRGSVLGSQDQDIHKVCNLNPSEPLVTLHTYSPPLDHMNTWQEQKSLLAHFQDFVRSLATITSS